MKSKIKFVPGFALYILITFGAPAHTNAQTNPLVSPIQSGGYLPGIMGVRDYANPGADGLFVLDYNIFLSASNYYDRNGDKKNSLDLPLGLEGSIPFEVDISGYINSFMFTYASPKLSFLGDAQYLFIVAPNIATTNTRVGLGQLTNGGTIDGGASGFGDLTVAPLMLSWGSEKFDLTTGYLFVAPTGKYQTGGDDNVGIGYWSHVFQAAAYYYPLPQKATAIMVMPSYEFHGKLKDADVKPGSRFLLEYGISQYLSERFEVTLQGGHSWQTGKDSGDDVYWDNSVKDQMSIFGGGLGYWLMPDTLYANAKYSTTYNNKQHFKADAFQIQLLFIPNLLKKKVDDIEND
jgi:hypothetical protein